MKCCLILAIVCIVSFFSANAQTDVDSVFLHGGGVYDGFTEEVLEKARVTIYDADSVTVLSGSQEGGYMVSVNGNTGKETRYFRGFNVLVPRRKVYVVRASYEGYAPGRPSVCALSLIPRRTTALSRDDIARVLPLPEAGGGYYFEVSLPPALTTSTGRCIPFAYGLAAEAELVSQEQPWLRRLVHLPAL